MLSRQAKFLSEKVHWLPSFLIDFRLGILTINIWVLLNIQKHENINIFWIVSHIRLKLTSYHYNIKLFQLKTFLWRHHVMTSFYDVIDFDFLVFLPTLAHNCDICWWRTHFICKTTMLWLSENANRIKKWLFFRFLLQVENMHFFSKICKFRKSFDDVSKK